MRPATKNERVLVGLLREVRHHWLSRISFKTDQDRQLEQRIDDTIAEMKIMV